MDGLKWMINDFGMLVEGNFDGRVVGSIHKIADRQLCAAAPEMLQKLDDVLSVLLDLDQDHLNRREEKMVCDAIQEIESVLAKARGES